MKSVVGHNIGKDPAGTAQWAESLPSGSLSRFALAATYRVWGAEDSAAAARHALSRIASPRAAEGYAAIVGQVAGRDVGAAYDMVSQLPAEGRESSAAALLEKGADALSADQRAFLQAALRRPEAP